MRSCQLGPVISYGSEGTVHAGTWRGNRAAIKVLVNHYARRVENEMKLVKNLDHANIIKYYELEYDQGAAYLSMELITGGNLYQFIQTQFTSSSYWSTIEQILQEIARGMVYLHARRIVQGDLKSHNILLREGTYQAVICDFGIARSLDNDNQEKKRSNTTKGTIRWMAPELCTPPPEPSSYLSDVWSYGCIILEITSAREPWIEHFHDDSLLFRALQRKENSSIFTRICANQSGPSHLRQLLIQCCAWAKKDRPQFTNILQKFTGEEDPDTSADEYMDCMSTNSPVENDDLPRDDFQEKTRTRSKITTTDYSKPTSHGGRLTGELYTSRGTANGRPIYEGVKGGLYYISASGSKVYLHK